MFHWLIELDKEVFLDLNRWHSPAWDSIMWWISRTNSWIPMYVVLLMVIIYKERPFRFLITLLFVAIVVVLCDQISSTLIKNLVARPRPTHNPEFAGMIHMVNGYKGGAYGFVSSHATNAFGVAIFLANQFKHYQWRLFLLGWAAVVSYSRIYLGVHYPLDVICGAILGTLIGIQCYVFKVKTAVYVAHRMAIRKEKQAARHKMQKMKEQKENAKKSIH